jgi:hypothetical protein
MPKPLLIIKCKVVRYMVVGVVGAGTMALYSILI